MRILLNLRLINLEEFSRGLEILSSGGDQDTVCDTILVEKLRCSTIHREGEAEPAAASLLPRINPEVTVRQNLFLLYELII